MDSITLILIFIGYFLLMKYVLPKLGIPTWMSNSSDFQAESQKDENENYKVVLWKPTV